MVFVIGKHKVDVSRPFRFCGRHKLALMFVVVLLALSMSASVCAMTSGVLSTPSARPVTASAPSGGRCPTTPHRDIVYRARYNYAAFNSCDWFMTFLFTNVTDYMTVEEQNAVVLWVVNYMETHDGFVRFPAYKRLWSRSEIGQPI